MRWIVIVLAMLLALPAVSQEAAPKKKKKPALRTEQKAHHRPTTDQIRKFNELEKKK